MMELMLNFFSLSQSRDPAVQAAILAQLNAKYGSGVLPDVPKDMNKASILSLLLLCLHLSCSCPHPSLQKYNQLHFKCRPNPTQLLYLYKNTRVCLVCERKTSIISSSRQLICSFSPVQIP